MDRITKRLLLAFVLLAAAGGCVHAKETIVLQQGVDTFKEKKPAWFDYLPVVSGITPVIIFLYLRKRRIKDELEKKEALSIAEQKAKKKYIDIENNKYAERYQVALAKELDKSNLPASNALDSFSVKLTDTFVSLRLSETWKCDTKFIPDQSQDMLKEKHRVRTPEEVMGLVFEKFSLMLVIGDPGSGKTTLLRHYVLTCLQKDGYNALGFTEPVMVFYLVLRELKKSGSNYASLSDNLYAWSEEHQLGIPKALFFNWLHNQKTLVLLDGLDEISDVDDRISVCKWIDKTFAGFPKAYVVVTSRTTGYRKGDGIEIVSEHVRVDIMDFSQSQQAEFLKKWFTAAFIRDQPLDGVSQYQQKQSEALEKAATIIKYLNKAENKSLQSLAGVPLLLQIMATLWKDREYLPGSRVKLYDAALDYLLDYRDRQKMINPLLPSEDARRVLAPISLWMHEELKKDEVYKAELHMRMQYKLQTVKNAPSAEAFCKNLVERAGLLVEYGDSEYVFRHKSFREYMAGVQLKEDHPDKQIDKLVAHFGNDWWEEPLRFFIAQVDENIFDLFMQKLFDSSVSEKLSPKQQDLLATLIKEARQTKIDALQVKLLDPRTTPRKQRYILDCLKTISIGNQAALEVIRTFIETGITKDVEIVLKAAAITRKKDISDTIHVLLDQQGAQYILIKGGVFTYSVTKQQEAVSDFYISKYTVTNQLYRRFISYLDAKEPEFEQILSLDAYKESLYAMAERIKGFSDYLQAETLLAGCICSHYANDKRFNQDEQPVVGVTWYDAKAYCLWLSLLESNSCDANLYRLPTEKEWEYAASGKENRTYPWSEADPTITCANYNQNEGVTTSVGCYPDGATPEGLYDMAGNVWEWVEFLCDRDDGWRSMRGGAWNHLSNTLRCSARLVTYQPNRVENNTGFRVILSGHAS
uniref:NACHT domain-containing protein n=1 Tax=Chlorobium chlorochromatii (strain CaD3) TaxID=340177 RepID=Q3ASA4_CHLCH